MFDLLDDPLADLCTTRTVLIELKYALYLKRADIRRSFPSLAFAAKVMVDSRTAFLRSLDDVCLERIREATKYSIEGGYSFSDYEVDRFIVWKDLDEAKLPLSTLSDEEVRTQLEVIEVRGYQDRIRVHMAVEVDVYGDSGSSGDKQSDSGASADSVESMESGLTIGTAATVKTID